MKRLFLLALLLSVASLGFAADHLWLTVYNQNYAVVRDVRSFNLPQGQSDIEFGNLSPMILDSPVRLTGKGVISLEQSFQFHHVSNELLLHDFLGKSLTFLMNDGTTISGTLISQPSNLDTTAKFLLQLTDTTVRTVRWKDVQNYQYASLPADYRIKPTMIFKVESAAAGAHEIEAAYEVQGMDWEAHYLLDLSKDDSTATFSGWATVANGTGIALDHARITLVSGRPRRHNPQLRLSNDQRTSTARNLDGLRSGRSQLVNLSALNVSGIETATRGGAQYGGFQAATENTISYEPPQHERMFDLQVYTLPYETSFSDGAAKEINLFPPTTIKTTSRYEYAYWQNSAQIGEYLLTVNTDSVGLGTPIPAGPVQVYRFRAGDVPEFVGEDRMAAADKNDRIRIRVGYAEELVAERKLLKSTPHINDKYDEQWEVRLRNTRETDATIYVQDRFYDKWKMLSNSQPFNQVSQNYIEFPLTVPAGGETVLTYEVRHWKQRSSR